MTGSRRNGSSRFLSALDLSAGYEVKFMAFIWLPNRHWIHSFFNIATNFKGILHEKVETKVHLSFILHS